MDAQLEQVLDAYAAAEPGPSRIALAEWIREYPQYARELTEFTANWQLLEWADDQSASDTAAEADVVSDEDRLFLRGMSAAQSAFYALRAKRELDTAPELSRIQTEAASVADRTPITGLFDAASSVGLSSNGLKERVGLSAAILQKLNRRLIDPSTIPTRVIADLAAVLRRSVDTVWAYLRLDAAFAASAQHRSNQAPTLPKQREDFFDAVRNDLSLAESRKQELLALPRPSSSDVNTSPER
jgi:hypothetical protein